MLIWLRQQEYSLNWNLKSNKYRGSFQFTLVKYSLDPSGFGFIVGESGCQLAGHTVAKKKEMVKVLIPWNFLIVAFNIL